MQTSIIFDFSKQALWQRVKLCWFVLTKQSFKSSEMLLQIEEVDELKKQVAELTNELAFARTILN